jgi:hypothetical protein
MRLTHRRIKRAHTSQANIEAITPYGLMSLPGTAVGTTTIIRGFSLSPFISYTPPRLPGERTRKGMRQMFERSGRSVLAAQPEEPLYNIPGAGTQGNERTDEVIELSSIERANLGEQNPEELREMAAPPAYDSIVTDNSERGQ